MPKYRDYEILSAIYRNKKISKRVLAKKINTSVETVHRTIAKLNNQYKETLYIDQDEKGYYFKLKEPSKKLNIHRALSSYFDGDIHTQILAIYFSALFDKKLEYQGYYSRKQIARLTKEHNLPSINEYKKLTKNEQKYIICQMYKSSITRYLEQYHLAFLEPEIYSIEKNALEVNIRHAHQITKELLISFDQNKIYSNHYYCLYAYVLIELIINTKPITEIDYNLFSIQKIPNILNTKVLNTIFVFDFNLAYHENEIINKTIKFDHSSLKYKLDILKTKKYIKTNHMYVSTELLELKGNTFGFYTYIQSIVSFKLHPNQLLVLVSQYLGDFLINLKFSSTLKIHPAKVIENNTYTGSNATIHMEQSKSLHYKLTKLSDSSQLQYNLYIKYNNIENLIILNTALINTISPMINLDKKTLYLITDKSLALISYQILKLKRNFPQYQLFIYSDIYYLNNITEFRHKENIFSITPIKSPKVNEDILPLLPLKNDSDNFDPFI